MTQTKAPPATAAEINDELAARRGRLRELTDQRNTLSDSVEQAGDAVAAAIARNSQKDIETERARVRSGTDQINELSRAIAFVEKEATTLEADLKAATIRETIAAADQLEAECRAGVLAMRDRVDSFVSVELPRAEELSAKLQRMNHTRETAKRLKGEPITATALTISRLDLVLGGLVGQFYDYVRAQRMAAAARQTIDNRKAMSAEPTEVAVAVQ